MIRFAIFPETLTLRRVPVKPLDCVQSHVINNSQAVDISRISSMCRI